MDLHKQVKSSLEEFVSIQVKDFNLSLIDEILIDYVVRILDDLVCGGNEEGAFDSESFYEMMCAFLPAFGRISCDSVNNWLYHLTDQIKLIKHNEGNNSNLASSWGATAVSNDCNVSSCHAVENAEQSGTSNNGCHNIDSDDNSKVSKDDIENKIRILAEMFPASCSLEISQCISACNGDMDLAAQMVLHREESGECYQSNFLPSYEKKKNMCYQDDNEVKQQIIAKYSYIDQADDTREHRPPPLKSESKKLVRYRDNKIVSMKGEKFTEIKKEESEDLKKTYVNLKPAKQYRFH